MKTLLRSVVLLSLVVWVGGIIFFAFVLAPTLFSTLRSRELAGRVVTRSLSALHACGIIAALVLLVASLAESKLTRARVTVRCAAIAGMLLLTLISQFGVSPRMESLRRDMGVIDAVPASDPRRVQFNQLHQWSTGLESGVLLLGLIVVVLVAREPAQP